MPHIRNYLDRQKASLLLCIAIRRKPPIPQPRKHEIGIHIIPPRNLTNRNPRNPRLRTDHPLLVIAPVPDAYFASALIAVNLNKMKALDIGFSDIMQKIPMSEMTNEEKKLLERLQEESVR